MTRAADMLALYAAAFAAVCLFGCVLLYAGCRRIRRSMTKRLAAFNEAAETQRQVEQSERPSPWGESSR